MSSIADWWVLGGKCSGRLVGGGTSGFPAGISSRHGCRLLSSLDTSSSDKRSEQWERGLSACDRPLEYTPRERQEAGGDSRGQVLPTWTLPVKNSTEVGSAPWTLPRGPAKLSQPREVVIGGLSEIVTANKNKMEWSTWWGRNSQTWVEGGMWARRTGNRSSEQKNKKNNNNKKKTMIQGWDREAEHMAPGANTPWSGVGRGRS